MNRDDIIHMALEAGILVPSYGDHIKHLEAFAALVAAAERETCAAVCFRQPLTDEQIAAAVAPLYQTRVARQMGLKSDIDTARAIERAHSIGVKT